MLSITPTLVRCPKKWPQHSYNVLVTGPNIDGTIFQYLERSLFILMNEIKNGPMKICDGEEIWKEAMCKPSFVT